MTLTPVTYLRLEIIADTLTDAFVGAMENWVRGPSPQNPHSGSFVDWEFIRRRF